MQMMHIMMHMMHIMMQAATGEVWYRLSMLWFGIPRHICIFDQNFRFKSDFKIKLRRICMSLSLLTIREALLNAQWWVKKISFAQFHRTYRSHITVNHCWKSWDFSPAVSTHLLQISFRTDKSFSSSETCDGDDEGVGTGVWFIIHLSRSGIVGIGGLLHCSFPHNEAAVIITLFWDGNQIFPLKIVWFDWQGNVQLKSNPTNYLS